MSLGDKSDKPKLFAFINQGNLKNLVYLFKNESPERISLVLSYLKNDWASYVLQQLPAELQSKVAIELANVKQLEPDDVEVMELELKKKIDYLIGGAAQVIELCERSDKKTAENILSTLEISNPELAEQLKLHFLGINDLYYIDQVGLRLIFREISLPSWAIGLRAARNAIREKVLNMLPQGAAEMLMQEMDLNTSVPQVKIEEEENRIVMTMRKLRDEGKIIIDKSKVPQEQRIEPFSTTGKKEMERIETDERKTESRDERLAKIKERLKKERGG